MDFINHFLGFNEDCFGNYLKHFDDINEIEFLLA